MTANPLRDQIIRKFGTITRFAITANLVHRQQEIGHTINFRREYDDVLDALEEHLRINRKDYGDLRREYKKLNKVSA